MNSQDREWLEGVIEAFIVGAIFGGLLAAALIQWL